MRAVLNRKVDAGATFANFTDGKDAAWIQYLKIPKSKTDPRDRLLRADPAITLFSAPVSTPTSARKSRGVPGAQPRSGRAEELRDLYTDRGLCAATDQDYESIRAAFKIAGINLREALKKRVAGKMTIRRSESCKRASGPSTHVLRGVNLKVEQGEFLGVIGLCRLGEIDAAALHQPALDPTNRARSSMPHSVFDPEATRPG